MSDFKKRFFGKWVLSGEHSVLRSGSALVYPLPHYYIDFYYKKSNTALQIIRKGKYRADLEFSTVPLIERALKLTGKKKEELKGSLLITSCIPFGAGLGASAVICSGIASLFLYKGWIKRKNLRDFAISLEKLFHGESSGMDVTAILKNKALLYQKGKRPCNLPQSLKKPLLFLSYSGGRSSTSTSVSQVQKFFNKNRKSAKLIDKNMEQSVQLCLMALKEKNKIKCNALLAEALSLGTNCFQQWDLISYDLERHIDQLKKQGALSLKPTGSGLGGYVISLWNTEPPANIKKNLIPLSI